MKYVLTAVVAMMAVVLLAVPAMADWDEAQPAKWVQMPAVGPNDWGMNVLASTVWWEDQFGNPIPVQKVLADDFECTETGPITDIHIWGSWLDDFFPYDEAGGIGPDPKNVAFKLSIHKDDPAYAGTDFSRPILPAEWEVTVLPSAVRWWADSYEDFWDPNLNEVIGHDTQVYQYNFFFDEAEAYWQEGTPDAPVIYWLNVTAMPFSEDATFGWKTSHDHWKDDAVYWDEGPFGLTDPQEMFDLRPVVGDGITNPYFGESLDMAFVITPEPGTVAMLLGAGLIGLVAGGRRRRRD